MLLEERIARTASANDPSARASDYVLSFSGADVDKAIGIALNLNSEILDLGIIGCINLTPNSQSESVALNNLTSPGIFTCDKYTQGPAFSENNLNGITPIEVIVSATHTPEGEVDRYFQFFTAKGQVSFRSKSGSDGSSWEPWSSEAGNIIVDMTVSMEEEEKVTLYRADGDITVVDQLGLLVRIPKTNAEGAQIIIGSDKFDILTSDGQPIREGVLAPHAYVQLYCSLVDGTRKFYAIGVGGTKDIEDNIDEIKNYFGTGEGNMDQNRLIYNSGTVDAPVLKTTTMTKEDSEQIHNLRSSKNKFLAVDGSGRIIASDLEYEGGSGGGGSGSTNSFVWMEDLKASTPISVADIPDSITIIK